MLKKRVPFSLGFQKNEFMDFILVNIWLILFVVLSLPLGYYRSKFRKMVYQTDSWVINIKPVFGKEIKGLFGNLYPENVQYKRF